MIFSTYTLLIVFLCGFAYSDKSGDDLYKLLDVSRDANVQEIRKAFKKLAVKLHPDKNTDDPNAHENFLKIARAYEILKQPDTRKHYDLHGDSEFNEGMKPKYQSYTYYRDQFGIYDDDPIIVTLSNADYEVTVLDDNQAWFVNFYSANCHHCHDLAPIWRKIAAEFQGVIRVAAVNCEEDWSLCYQLSIESYPTLIYYDQQANLHAGHRYQGSRTYEELEEYVLSKIKVDVKEVTLSDWEKKDFKKQEWILFICSKGVNCLESTTIIKVAAALEGLVNVGKVEESKLVKKLQKKNKDALIVFWQILKDDEDSKKQNIQVHTIEGSDSKEIVENVLNILPNPDTINEKKFKEIHIQLKKGSTTPWLFCFYIGQATELNLQLKRLPSLLSNIKIGLIHCGKSSKLCTFLNIPRYPAWGVLKVGGAFEMHHGRDVLHEITAFAKDSVKSTNLHALSVEDFERIKEKGEVWFIDWYAPWCPPCRNLMPELRRASQHFDAHTIQFGTIDCTMHKNMCTHQGIAQYPTTIFYNGSKIEKFHGVPNEDGIVEFIEDMMNPLIISVDEKSFSKLKKKPLNEIWVVDFYAPWCGPCQKLTLEWRKLAKQMLKFPEVKVAQIDCVENANLCTAQNIKAYPTVRLYPMDSKGLDSVVMYNGNRDVMSFKRWILNFIPSSVVSLTSLTFKENILLNDFNTPWLINFYAPWCGHCTHFETEFRTVAEKLQDTVKSGKLDCQMENAFCRQVHVDGYPTVMLYLTPTERYEITSRAIDDIVNKVLTLVNRHKRKLSHEEL